MTLTHGIVTHLWTVSVPNFGHWYPRVRTAAGLFDYDRRGILDRGHVRFFTKRSMHRLFSDCGYDVVRTTTTGLPVDAVGLAGSRAVRAMAAVDRTAAWLRPQLFAYQFLVELSPRRPPPEAVTSEGAPDSTSQTAAAS